MHTRTLTYGGGVIYDFACETMLEVLEGLRAFVGSDRKVHFETRRYFDDAMQTDYECYLRENTIVTTSTMTNCGFALAFVVRTDDVEVAAAVENWLNAEMARRLPPRPSPKPISDPEPTVLAPLTVAEPPDAPLSPGEKAIVDLVVAGKTHHDADKEGGFRDFVFRDGRFVQLYGSYADGTRGEVVYAGPKAFVRDLIATCDYERARAANDDDLLEAIRRSIAARSS